MNFRQIKLLNDLEVRVAELMEAMDYQEKRIITLERDIEPLKNPPKRKPGRPRKKNVVSVN